MDADQTEICQFLRTFQDQFVSGKEICRRAGGKWRFREEPTWALPILRRMFESKIVETDEDGRFRLTQPSTPGKATRKKVWMSPAIQRILEESGKNFGVFEVDKDEMESVDVGTISLLPEGQSVDFIRQHQ